ncbi:MAG: isoprenyl transferase [Christensenellaceae bacterium]|nr:isoprenyl transferase [Christensenellaceae bacterium]
MRIYPKYTEAELKKLGLVGKLPEHIGIIMDGNGRWAKQRLMPRSAGHRAGMEALQDIVRTSHSLGIGALTVYAFSTENWGRPAAEIDALMSLLVEYFYKEIDELDANNVRIRTLGELSRFAPKLRTLMETAVQRTENNTGLNFSIAINYGSRAEIVRAVKMLVEEGIPAESITEKCFAEHLYTGELPELDLIIRTAGEQRLSNFLLYQAAYAEFVFTETLFPAFTPEVYCDCIKEFMHRTRRFGKVKE